jgi:hypothetical protein
MMLQRRRMDKKGVFFSCAILKLEGDSCHFATPTFPIDIVMYFM